MNEKNLTVVIIAKEEEQKTSSQLLLNVSNYLNDDTTYNTINHLPPKFENNYTKNKVESIKIQLRLRLKENPTANLVLLIMKKNLISFHLGTCKKNIKTMGSNKLTKYIVKEGRKRIVNHEASIDL